MSKNMKRVLPGLAAIAFNIALGACADRMQGPRLSLSDIDKKTEAAAETDPERAAAIKDIRKFNFWVLQDDAKSGDEPSIKTTIVIKKDANNIDDVKALGTAQGESLVSKVVPAIISGAATVAAGAVLGAAMPGSSTVNCLKQSQGQATSGINNMASLGPC